MTIQISEESVEVIRYALQVAKAMDQVAYAQAEYTYNKDRMGEIQARIDALDKALAEV
jgi:transcription elongation GreA/GreB family factor